MRMVNLKLATWAGLATVLVSFWAISTPSAASTVSAPSTPFLSPAADTGSGDAPDSDSTFDNIEVVDAGLKGRLEITRVGSEPSPNNLITVFAGFKNKTDHPLKIEVQTIYKNAMGDPLNSGSWIALVLKPHEEKEYRSTSISEQFNPNAVNAPFLIRVRRPAPPAH